MNLDTAYAYFVTAASSNDPLGHNGLGYIYFRGTNAQAANNLGMVGRSLRLRWFIWGLRIFHFLHQSNKRHRMPAAWETPRRGTWSWPSSTSMSPPMAAPLMACSTSLPCAAEFWSLKCVALLHHILGKRIQMHCLNDESMSKTSTLGLLDLGNQQHRSTSKANRRVKPHTRYLTGTAVQESFQKAVLYYTQARALVVVLTLWSLEPLKDKCAVSLSKYTYPLVN